MHFSIKCRNCQNEYIGENSRSLNKRLYEHKKDILKNNTQNTLVVYHNENDHNFDTWNATLIKRENNSLRQKCLESILIASSGAVILRPRSYHS